MKRSFNSMKVYLVFLVFFLFGSIRLSAQNTVRDTLFLKSGSVLVGYIINPDDPESVRIKTDGGATLYVNTSRIEKMFLEQPRPSIKKQSDQITRPPTIADDRFAFGLNGGMALPISDFANVQGAAAGIGFSFQAAAWIKVSDNLKWSNRVSFVSNGLRKDEFRNAQSLANGVNFVKGIFGKWTSWNFQTGLSSMRELDTDFQLIIEGHIGFSRFQSPQISLFTDQNIEYRLDKTMGAGFNSGLSVSVLYQNKYQVGLELLRSNPIFTFNSPGQSSTLIQPYRVISLKIGYLIS
jgi:hypothetical protein